MKIPKKIKIRNKSYRVEQVELDGYLGLCHYESKLLQLSPEQSQESLYLTMIHECLHGLLFEYGFHGNKLEERLVCELEALIKKYFIPN